jgi:hypothetical protein
MSFSKNKVSICDQQTTSPQARQDARRIKSKRRGKLANASVGQIQKIWSRKWINESIPCVRAGRLLAQVGGKSNIFKGFCKFGRSQDAVLRHEETAASEDAAAFSKL